MTFETALLLAMLSAGAAQGGSEVGGHPAAARPGDPVESAPGAVPNAFVLAEMAPAPGRWEVEDAPAYFSDRRAFVDQRLLDHVGLRVNLAVQPMQ